MKRQFSVTLFALLCALFQINAQQTDNRYYEINKNIEVFNSVVKELDMFYVDTVNVEQLIQTGIGSMLSSLDPYTNYITEDDMESFKVLTTGDYAGIGSYIVPRKIDNEYRVVISGPYENSPAAKAGLKEGDIILEVDGKDMTRLEEGGNPADGVYGGKLSNQVSSSLKGTPGTAVKIKVQRPGEKKAREFTVTRENIHMSSVPYYGVLENNVGYIAFTGFTDRSWQEVKTAFSELKKDGITSLILDLRGNGGGILDESVQIVNFFVPRGEVVLTTKGKVKQAERVYRTTLPPVDTEIPMVVLVDNGSASAAEIVSGALQDLDRAVIIGERTYGKGLVQAPRELPYGGSLKITTSKYYIPSGRCIQAIDYSHRNIDGTAGRIPDSLTTVFRTAIGREVRDGGGVTPDIVVKEDKTPSLVYYLASQYLIFDFVTGWASEHQQIGPVEAFSVTDADYAAFKEFVKSRSDFKYDMLSEKTLASLKEVMEYEGYMGLAEEEYKALEEKLAPDLDRDLDNFKDEITELINLEIVKRYYYTRGEIQQGLKNDKQVREAINVLNDPVRYKQILSPGFQQPAAQNN